jgi:hypothetical protein
MRTWLIAFLLVAGAVAAGTNSTTELLRQLGAEDCATRDRAEAQLRTLGSAVVPQLQTLTNSPDPEIRLRVQRLLTVIPPDLQTFLDRQSRCTGQASEGGSVWPCILQITAAEAGTNTFRGTIEWTNLNALHAIEGQLETNRLVFRETKAICQGNAALGVVYTFPLTGRTGGRLVGEWQDSRSSRRGPAELDLQDAPLPARQGAISPGVEPVEPIPWLQEP